MCDPTGEHITRIHINCSRQTPSPIRSKKTVPVCTSTPIINVPVCDPSSKQQMNLIAKEVLANQRATSETFIRKTESPPAPPRPQIDSESLVFISKETGQQIDLNTGEGIGKIIQPNSGTITKKKKQQRQSLAVVPPTGSTRSSKSSDDGDYVVPMTNETGGTKDKPKTNFTSYNGVQMFTFTLDDD